MYCLFIRVLGSSVAVAAVGFVTTKALISIAAELSIKQQPVSSKVAITNSASI